MVSWSRTVSENNFDNQFYLNVAGGYQFISGDYTTTWTKNTKTFKISLVDYLEDEEDDLTPMKADWMFNDDYENEYEDTYWSSNLFQELDADLYADLNKMENYYDSWLTDEGTI